MLSFFHHSIATNYPKIKRSEYTQKEIFSNNTYLVYFKEKSPIFIFGNQPAAKYLFGRRAHFLSECNMYKNKLLKEKVRVEKKTN